MEPKDSNGLTAEEWLNKQFEFELCAECGGDHVDHDAAMVLGNWFAVCRYPQFSE